MENSLDEIDLNHLLELVQNKLELYQNQEEVDEWNSITILSDLESKILELLDG